MKKLNVIIAVLIVISFTGCTKKTTQQKTASSAITSLARTVGPITFEGQTAWLQFGTRVENGGGWICQNSYDFCHYRYISSTEGYTATGGEATGEIGYMGNVLVIALDKSTMTAYDQGHYLTRDGEFHWGAQGYIVTEGFDIKNADDADQNTIGDIHVDAGTYPVYEDENSILVVFEEP